MICLVPEPSCMTGLTDMVRADFKVMKDIATHTRISPNHRQVVTYHYLWRLLGIEDTPSSRVLFRGCIDKCKFLERVNQSPKARKELESWGLQVDMQMIAIEGRKLPLRENRLPQQDHHCQ